MLTLNKSKKIVCLIIVIMMLLQVKTFAVVSQTNDFYVNDYARKLSSDTKEYIMNMNIELQKKTGAQIVVVTVQSLGGQSIEEYATELFRKFGIGDKEKNNGVLLNMVLYIHLVFFQFFHLLVYPQAHIQLQF